MIKVWLFDAALFLTFSLFHHYVEFMRQTQCLDPKGLFWCKSRVRKALGSRPRAGGDP
jgi:hypothetical protein